MRKIQLDGRKIKKLRSAREQGSTQNEFSHEIRISERKLRAVENDLDAVSIQTANRIAGALKKPLQALLLVAPEPPAPSIQATTIARLFPPREILPRFDETIAGVISDEAKMFDLAKGNRVVISHVMTPRSNSAKTPSIRNMALPAVVEVRAPVDAEKDQRLCPADLAKYRADPSAIGLNRSTDQAATMSNSFAFTAFIMASSPGR
jgi:transcriptional regulator with XRE-family HTH domain